MAVRAIAEGLEGAARRLRHGVFAGAKANWLGLAITVADQAETVLLDILRGAGVSGAAGMLAERPQLRADAGAPLARRSPTSPIEEVRRRTRLILDRR